MNPSSARSKGRGMATHAEPEEKWLQLGNLRKNEEGKVKESAGNRD